MTLVVLVSDGTEIFGGADSALSAPGEIYDLEESKIFVRDRYLVGFCSSVRIGQVLRYEVELPEPPELDDLTPFFVREVVPILRETVARCGMAGAGAQILGELTMLAIGCRGQIFCLNPALAVMRVPYAAIGSGRHHAYGALHALHAAGVAPGREMVEMALRASASFHPGVRAPLIFVSSTDETRVVTRGDGRQPQVGKIPTSRRRSLSKDFEN